MDRPSFFRSLHMLALSLIFAGSAVADVPLDAALAEALLKLRLTAPYNRETDWVFASPTMKGTQPLWPETLWQRYGRPAVKAANIQKGVGFHTFRHVHNFAHSGQRVTCPPKSSPAEM